MAKIQAEGKKIKTELEDNISELTEELKSMKEKLVASEKTSEKFFKQNIELQKQEFFHNLNRSLVGRGSHRSGEHARKL